MPKLIYKPIAVQNECLGGQIGTNSKEKIIFILLMAQGVSYKYYKTDTMSFPNEKAMVLWVEETKIKILPEREFRLLKESTYKK